MNYNVKWNESTLKDIFGATKDSEHLMDYLERKLFEKDLVVMSGEFLNTSSGRKEGFMNYYYKKESNHVLLTSAPRKGRKYIHVVLKCKIFERETIESNGLTPGNNNEPPDLKIHSESEVNKLIELIQQYNYKLV